MLLSIFKFWPFSAGGVLLDDGCHRKKSVARPLCHKTQLLIVERPAGPLKTTSESGEKAVPFLKAQF